MIRAHLLIPLILLISACSNKETPLASLPDLSAVRANLALHLCA